MRGTPADRFVVAVKPLLGAVGVERRGRVIRGLFTWSTGVSGRSPMGELKPSGKPFAISKAEVWEAYRQVKANKGAAGVDGQTIEDFETDLKNNLYKIWNRMSSGSYFPPAVKALEAKVEPIFHPDSYGYRPARSALDAVAACRERCWRKDWVIDLDIAKFFDSVPWDLIVKAVEANTDQPWVVLYVKRWLQAPLALPDGSVQQRDRGTRRVGGLARAGQSVHALRVRCVDGPRVPGRAVRTLLRRRGRALRQSTPSPPGEGGDRGQDGPGRAATAPDQDQDRLLQGRDEAGHLPAHLVHVPRFHVPGPRGAVQSRGEVHLVPARDQQASPQEDQR
jgi:hypothetical protein